jgi:hypothetical protein
MSGDGWRTSVRWVVAHPTEPKVLLAGRAAAELAGAGGDGDAALAGLSPELGIAGP